MKLFISHSSKDIELVDIFCQFLVNQFRMDEEDIFCTSRKGVLVVGEDFIRRIKENLHYTPIVIFLITENYMSSKFCLIEMGAAWAFKDTIVPIIVPPLGFDALLDTPLKTIQLISITDSQQLIANLYNNILVGKNIIKRLSPMQEQRLGNAATIFTVSVREIVEKLYGKRNNILQEASREHKNSYNINTEKETAYSIPARETRKKKSINEEKRVNDINMYMMSAKNNYVNGNYQLALDLLNKVVEMDPNIKECYVIRAKVLRALGKYGRAELDEEKLKTRKWTY